MTQETFSTVATDSADNNTTVLIIRRNGVAPRKQVLDARVVTIGRDDRNDLVLNAESVSRIHARLEYEQEAWHIIDLGSTNGTFLNAERLPSYTPHAFSHIDELLVGDFELELMQIADVEDGKSAETLLVSADNVEDASVTEEISLARQTFDESKLDTLQRGRDADTILFTTLLTSLSQKEARQRSNFQFSIWPQLLLHSGQVMVSILNEASTAQQVTIEVLHEKGIACAAGLISAEIPAGAEHRVALNLQATATLLFGEPQDYPFSVVINRESAEPQMVQGNIRVEPRLSTTMLLAGSGLIVLLVAVWLINMFLQG